MVHPEAIYSRLSDGASAKGCRSWLPPGLASMSARIFLSGALAMAAVCSRLPALDSDFISRDADDVIGEPALKPEGERRSESIARYLQSIFEEETLGPDRALLTKRQVLSLEPGFTDLAMEVAHQYLRRGEVPEALSVLKDAAKASPKRVEPPVALAGIYLRQLQKPDLAEKFANQALASCPDDSAPYQILYEIYRSNGQGGKIPGLFAKALKRSGPSADFWLDLADLKLREKDGVGHATMGALLERAQASAGENPDALVRVAEYFTVTGQTDRAVPLFQLALKLKPGLEGIREKLSELLIAKGDLTEASQLLAEIIQANPLDYRAYDRLAAILVKSGDLPKALVNMKQALLVAPPDPRRYEEIIRLSLRTGDGNGALKVIDDSEKPFPGVLEFALYKALALSEVKRHEEALQIFERILVEAARLRPGLLDADFFFSYGVAAEQAGRYVKAADLFKKAIELDPENAARACNYLGYMWADRGENLEEAEQLIRRAVAADPQSAAYLDSLGWVLFRQGRYAEALEELLRAASLFHEAPDPVVYEHVGDAYEKLDKSAEAVLYWQKALRLDPGNDSLARKIDGRSSRVVKTPSSAAQ